jgi:hypothetical protein
MVHSPNTITIDAHVLCSQQRLLRYGDLQHRPSSHVRTWTSIALQSRHSKRQASAALMYKPETENHSSSHRGLEFESGLG